MSNDRPDGSEACFAHLLVDGHVIDPQTRRDVAVFRKAERTRLYARRQAQSVAELREMSRSVAGQLDHHLGDVTGQTIGVFWPIKGELDLRDWMAEAHQRGAALTLPVVIEKNAPVVFHHWEPGCEMARGFWSIPVPATPRALVPDIVIVPLLGVDTENYRLGNGGGYYDRTLVRLPAVTRIIGVGQPFAAMNTIFPMAWDIPMQHVILASPCTADTL